MPGVHRRQITDAIVGRQRGLVAAELERAGEAAEGGDIERAADNAKRATDAAWPPDNPS
jgi:hypothetical protein